MTCFRGKLPANTFHVGIVKLGLQLVFGLCVQLSDVFWVDESLKCFGEILVRETSELAEFGHVIAVGSCGD